MGERGFLDVGRDPDIVARHQCHGAAAGGHVLPRIGHLGDAAGERRGHLRVLQVEPGGLKGRCGRAVIGVLLHRDVRVAGEACADSLQGTLELVHLVPGLIAFVAVAVAFGLGADAALGESLVALVFALGVVQVVTCARQRLGLFGILGLECPDAGARVGQGRLGLVDGGAVGRRVDGE
ncbi:hypothetical protein KBTX_04103 [wastewater metagenome]|uniref:Uncharacterized protein n=2 Tax=unclassified sequences TaxID=12908 RepID=A0A5B8RGH8_9ZZZZ|nr:hypothetical protein KBTEX_04103 [uncultured organism]